LLRSSEFIAAHRANPCDFTRKRLLSPDILVEFLLQMVGGRSLQVGLDQFFSALGSGATLAREITKSALSQARKKLMPSALGALWVREWLAATGEHRWRGLRVVAADGTCVRVPRWRETQEAYGVDGPNGDGSVVMARVVGLLAVASNQIVHAEIGAYTQGERSLLVRALAALSAHDLLGLDRGYPAWWLFALFVQRGIAFCARLERCGCASLQVKQFIRSGAVGQIIEHKLSSKALASLRQAGGAALPGTVLRLRLVRVALSTGNIEVLATALLDTVAYPAAEFAALYHARWRIEEAFKTLKCRLKLEGFSGELPYAIEQEIYAKILLANITAALCSQAHARLDEDKAAQYQVNKMVAIGHWSDLVVAWIKGGAESLKQKIEEFVVTLTHSLEKSRPGRSSPRKFSVHGAQRPRRAYI
jgi:hypothetical protein